MPRNKQKNLARAAAHRAEKSKDMRLGRSVEAALTGCSNRVLKAVTQAPNWRNQSVESSSICLPEVAQFAAGFRKPTEAVTAR